MREEMFICLDCQHIFEDPVCYTNTHGLDTPPYEIYYGCPKCGGAYTRAYICDCCNEWIQGDYIKVGDHMRYCSECCRSMELGDE